VFDNNSSSQNIYFGLADTLDKELSIISLGAAAPAAASSNRAAAMAAQTRLLAVGTAGGSGNATALGLSCGADAVNAQHAVEASDASMMGTSMWLPSNGQTQL
jgi:hypothetical protein